MTRDTHACTDSYHVAMLQRKQLMSYKARDADQLNSQNEKFRQERAKQLEREIEQATQEHSASKKPRERKDSRKGSTAGATGAAMDESVTSPSICPTTPLEAMVSDGLV